MIVDRCAGARISLRVVSQFDLWASLDMVTILTHHFSVQNINDSAVITKRDLFPPCFFYLKDPGNHPGAKTSKDDLTLDLVCSLERSKCRKLTKQYKMNENEL